MIGTLPMQSLAPLDYRYALDAALATIGHVPSLVQCDVPELVGDLIQRVPEQHDVPALAGLWVEPLRDSWRTVIQTFTDRLAPAAPLAIVASCPFARLLPERRSWSGQPLGMQWRGLSILGRTLQTSGFIITATYGIHTFVSIGLSLLGQGAERMDRPELGDRLHFRSRLRYCTSGPLASCSTVALIVARKQRHA